MGRLSGADPYWLGEFSLVDISFYRWFERMPVLDHFRKFALSPETPRLQNWWNAVRDRPSVHGVENPASYYIDRFTKILDQPAIVK